MTESRPLAVMHIIDTLTAAGAERVAVNIVNHLPRDRFTPYLCTTRADGPLDALVAPAVIRLRLQRKSRFDVHAVAQLRQFVLAHKIRILHVHSSSLFIARMAAFGLGIPIVWHAHYGRYASEDQRALRYRAATLGIEGIITVSKELADWSVRRLSVPATSIWYVPNPVSCDEPQAPKPPDLPGAKGQRVVCVANFRPEKDHLTLIHALAKVVRIVPEAHLLLVGQTNNSEYRRRLESEISSLRLQKNVSFLGSRNDISDILRACDIGVLSSASEGLPMALLEYGAARLPAIATTVGQCGDVLDHGGAGILVPPGAVGQLSDALVSLLQSPAKRSSLSASFHARITQRFDATAVGRQISDIYDQVCGIRRARMGQPITNQPLSPGSRAPENRTSDRGRSEYSAAVSTPGIKVHG